MSWMMQAKQRQTDPELEGQEGQGGLAGVWITIIHRSPPTTPATPTPPRLPLAAELTVWVPAEQEEAEQQQQQQRCGPQGPGAPSEQHGCGQGSSRRGTTPSCGLHRGPCGPGSERRGQPWAAGPDGHPVFSPAVESPPHLLQGRGVPNLTLSEAGWGAGKGEVEGRPAPSKQEPAPPPTWVQVSPPLG